MTTGVTPTANPLAGASPAPLSTMVAPHGNMGVGSHAAQYPHGLRGTAGPSSRQDRPPVVCSTATGGILGPTTNATPIFGRRPVSALRNDHAPPPPTTTTLSECLFFFVFFRLYVTPRGSCPSELVTTLPRAHRAALTQQCGTGSDQRSSHLSLQVLPHSRTTYFLLCRSS